MKLDLERIEKFLKDKENKAVDPISYYHPWTFGDLEKFVEQQHECIKEMRAALEKLHDNHTVEPDDSPRYCTAGCEVLTKWFGE